jgi:translation elongation factor EF-Ts
VPGRIETYTHSDNVTKNKAVGIVKVTTQTDFSTKNDKFIDFCKKAAKFACGYQTTNVELILSDWPGGLQKEHLELQEELKEKIEIAEVHVMRIGN